jgi:hypothetical protein
VKRAASARHSLPKDVRSDEKWGSVSEKTAKFADTDARLLTGGFSGPFIRNANGSISSWHLCSGDESPHMMRPVSFVPRFRPLSTGYMTRQDHSTAAIHVNKQAKRARRARKSTLRRRLLAEPKITSQDLERELMGQQSPSMVDGNGPLRRIENESQVLGRELGEGEMGLEQAETTTRHLQDRTKELEEQDEGYAEVVGANGLENQVRPAEEPINGAREAQAGRIVASSSSTEITDRAEQPPGPPECPPGSNTGQEGENAQQELSDSPHGLTRSRRDNVALRQNRHELEARSQRPIQIVVAEILTQPSTLASQLLASSGMTDENDGHSERVRQNQEPPGTVKSFSDWAADLQ